MSRSKAEIENARKSQEVRNLLINRVRTERLFDDNPSPYTPNHLVQELLGRITNVSKSRVLVLFTIELAVYLVANGCTDVTVATRAYCRVTEYLAKKFECRYAVLQDEEFEMKFDVVVGNPPYQKLRKNEKIRGQSGNDIWPYFVETGLNNLRGGRIGMIHPSAWRDVGGYYEKIQNLIRSLDINWLSIHNYSEGAHYFNAGTRFDMYVATYKSSNKGVTTIRDENDNVTNVDLDGMKFIPNFDIEQVNKLVASGNETPIDLLFHRTMYGTDKKWMSSDRTEEYKYPCVYYSKKTTKDTRFYYSSRKCDHFGKPKVIFGCNGNVGNIICDYEGQYGLTQFVAGLVESPENLDDLKNALESEKFQRVMKSVQFGKPQYNRRVIALFKKKFYKEFI